MRKNAFVKCVDKLPTINFLSAKCMFRRMKLFFDVVDTFQCRTMVSTFMLQKWELPSVQVPKGYLSIIIFWNNFQFCINN